MSSPEEVAQGQGASDLPVAGPPAMHGPPASVQLRQVNAMSELEALEPSSPFDIEEFADAGSLEEALKVMVKKLLSYKVIDTWGLWQQLFRKMSDFYP